MKYKSRAYYMAQCEALDAQYIQVQAECTRLRTSRDELAFEVQNLQHMLTALRRAQQVQAADTETIGFNALSMRCKKLSELGIPALIHRGHVLHSRTRAIINPNQYGVGT